LQLADNEARTVVVLTKRLDHHRAQSAVSKDDALERGASIEWTVTAIPMLPLPA
jgi:hypothetical protein